MAQYTGRNVEQPEYLNEKDQAEDRKGTQEDKKREKVEKRPERNSDIEREEERVESSITSKTFQH